MCDCSSAMLLQEWDDSRKEIQRVRRKPNRRWKSSNRTGNGDLLTWSELRLDIARCLPCSDDCKQSGCNRGREQRPRAESAIGEGAQQGPDHKPEPQQKGRRPAPPL